MGSKSPCSGFLGSITPGGSLFSALHRCATELMHGTRQNPQTDRSSKEGERRRTSILRMAELASPPFLSHRRFSLTALLSRLDRVPTHLLIISVSLLFACLNPFVSMTSLLPITPKPLICRSRTVSSFRSTLPTSRSRSRS